MWSAPPTPCAFRSLLATFTIGNGARIYYKPDFFEVPTDLWLAVYWTLLCGTLIYLLGYGARALLILRKDPRSRKSRQTSISSHRPAASLACTVRIVTAWVPPLQTAEGGTLGLDLRLRLWRRIRPYISAQSWAHQDQMVQHRK